MSPVSSAPVLHASSSPDRFLFWSQAALSVVLVLASAGQLTSQWITSMEHWGWSVVVAVMTLAMLAIVIATGRNRRALRRDLVESDGKLRAAVSSVTAGDEALRVSELSNASSEKSLSKSLALNRLGEKKLHLAEEKGIAGDEELRLSVAAGLVGEEALRVSVANEIEGAEALRVSVANEIEGAEALRMSVADGIEGAEALRVSVANGIAGDEELRLSVAAGLVGEEALRLSVENGIAGEEKLRLSVAAGLVGKEALRLSVASGIEGAEALRVSVANEVEGAEALRVSVANEIAGDEKLRLSVSAGLVGAEALRVSVANAIQGAEALRVSIEQGIDAASTTLAVVDTVDAAITLYAPDGHILLTNDTARALAILARSGELDPHEFADDRVTLIPRFDQVLARAARGQLVTRRAYWVGTGDSQRAIMSTSQYVKRASGELIGTVVASHDVTPLARTRDEFLETVSHELRTPLTSMIGYLEIIEDSLDLNEAGISEEFEVVQRNTDRLLKLINDLLLTARGQVPAEKRAFDVVALAAKSVQALQHHAAQLDVTITVADVPPITAEIDADQIADVLDKVLSNALKFNRPGGSIEIDFRQDASSAIISIADTGIGINLNDQQRIFERFYRAPSTRTDFVAGVGLGLSAAKLIVDAHHGSITATSSFGIGTTIEISLPLIAESFGDVPTS
jgi:signal transduction histidine kinase